jgi:hypothetical protein
MYVYTDDIAILSDGVNMTENRCSENKMLLKKNKCGVMF